MKKIVQSVWLAGALAALLGATVAMSAQDNTTAPQSSPSQASPSQSGSQAQEPAPPPSQMPDAQQPNSAQPQTQTQQPSSESQSQSPSQPPAGQTPETTGQRPDQQNGSATASGTQSFTGTIVKSGDKYVFQDAASGNTYDIDHQDEVQKFEGKRVKVHGTLDSSGKTIHLQ